MKKFLSLVGFVGILFVACMADYWSGFYNRLSTCTYVSYIENVAEFTDNSGNVWEWEIKAGDNFTEGKAYLLHMHNNCSDSIYDDYIRKISK